ncbi:Regulator of nonsense transcripts upf2 [Lathyrus oleraceus]|uniref:Regulator of nonsense transcripts upf2 n=1 Tax=Pisum sativum TaxID=3888 RepID=A0A9D5AT88_PEA|nr:Regulator of nonsense transcripts upf2 [Pisum sativum]
MKDVSSLLLQMLEEEFNFLMNKKDQMNIETKIWNIRFIGELCKFKVAPAGLVFTCLKACLDDFSHHNIDVACNLLKTCGRFLYRSPETSIRMSNMLEILMRLKNVKNLDPRHSTLVENAYYLFKPPERSARVAKVCPPLHQHIRKLLFSGLDNSTIKHVLRQLRKLPWSDYEPYLLKCFMKETAILPLKKSNPELPELLAQFSSGIAGAGLVVMRKRRNIEKGKPEEEDKERTEDEFRKGSGDVTVQIAAGENQHYRRSLREKVNLNLVRGVVFVLRPLGPAFHYRPLSMFIFGLSFCLRFPQ